MPNNTKDAKTYADYYSVIVDVPFNESTGMTEYDTIPLMLRDKYGSPDTVSTYAYLNALRGAVIEEHKRADLLEERLKKAGL